MQKLKLNRGFDSIMSEYIIKNYSVVQSTSSPGAIAEIFLNDENNIRRSRINFFPDGSYIPVAEEIGEIGLILLTFPISRYASIVDLLRNESPIRVFYNHSTYAGIMTGDEPIGEEETPLN